MTDIINQDNERKLILDIKKLLNEARRRSYAVINTVLVRTNWEIGRMIVEAQGGEERATYGDGLLKRISKELTKEYGRGYSTGNLRYMR